MSNSPTRPVPRNAEDLVKDYSKLVYSIANQYSNSGVPLEDLRQEGMLGLIKAWESYDPAQGSELTTYATFWIRKYILSAVEMEHHGNHSFDALSPDSLDKVAVDDAPVGNDLAKYLKAFPEIEQMVIIASLAEEKTLKEIAQELGIRVEKARLIKLKALRRLRSVLIQNPGEIPADWKKFSGTR